MLVEILVGGAALFLLASASGGGSSRSSYSRRRYGNDVKDLRKNPNPKYVPYYAWIYSNGYFLADAELDGKLYRIHINGQLTMFDPLLRVETVKSMSIYGQWDNDTIFFAADKKLYLVNERLRRYNKYDPIVNCWFSIMEHQFKEALEKHKNEQQEQGV